MPSDILDSRVNEGMIRMLNRRKYYILDDNTSDGSSISYILFKTDQEDYGMSFFVTAKGQSIVKEDILNIGRIVISSEDDYSSEYDIIVKIVHIIIVCNKYATPDIRILMRCDTSNIHECYAGFFTKTKSGNSKRSNVIEWYNTRLPRMEMFHENDLCIDILASPYLKLTITLCTNDEIDEIAKNTILYDTDEHLKELKSHELIGKMYNTISRDDPISRYFGCVTGSVIQVTDSNIRTIYCCI